MTVPLLAASSRIRDMVRGIRGTLSSCLPAERSEVRPGIPINPRLHDGQTFKHTHTCLERCNPIALSASVVCFQPVLRS